MSLDLHSRRYPLCRKCTESVLFKIISFVKPEVETGQKEVSFCRFLCAAITFTRANLFELYNIIFGDRKKRTKSILPNHKLMTLYRVFPSRSLVYSLQFSLLVKGPVCFFTFILHFSQVPFLISKKFFHVSQIKLED